METRARRRMPTAIMTIYLDYLVAEFRGRAAYAETGITAILRMLDTHISLGLPFSALTAADIAKYTGVTRMGKQTPEWLIAAAIKAALPNVLETLMQAHPGGCRWARGTYTMLAMSSHVNHNFGATLRVLETQLRTPPPATFLDLCARFGSVKNLGRLVRSGRFRVTHRTLGQVLLKHSRSRERETLVRDLCKRVLADNAGSREHVCATLRLAAEVSTVGVYEAVVSGLQAAQAELPQGCSNRCSVCGPVIGTMVR